MYPLLYLFLFSTVSCLVKSRKYNDTNVIYAVLFLTLFNKWRDSLDSTVTRLLAGRLDTQALFPRWVQFFFFLFTASRPNMDPIQHLGMHNRGLSQKVQCRVVKLTQVQRNAEVNMRWRNTRTPQYIFTEWYLIQHGKNFTFHSLFKADFVTLQAARKVCRGISLFSQSSFLQVRYRKIRWNGPRLIAAGFGIHSHPDFKYYILRRSM